MPDIQIGGKGSGGISVTIDLHGTDKALIRKLNKLEISAQKTIVRKAIRAGSTPMLKALRRNAPRQDPAEREARGSEFEILHKNIARKLQTYRGVYMAVIGPYWPEASQGLWQELRGPNKGWARRAWDASYAGSAKAIEDKIRKGILAAS